MGASYGGEKKTPIWAWIAGGCLIGIVLVVIAFFVLGYGAYRWAKSTGEAIRDPQRRTEKTREILGCERLPEGYNAMLGVSIPVVADIAIITDKAPDEKGQIKDLGEHGLIYINMIRFGSKDEIGDYFSGKTNDPEVLRRNHINIDAEEIVKRGVIDGTPRLMYAVQRGNMHVETHSRRGLLTVVLVDCHKEDRSRLAIWFGPDPKPGQPLDEASLADSTGDEKKLVSFFKNFELCR